MKTRYAIIGNGVAGITAAQAIAKADSGSRVHIFGAESHPYYPRPRLWEYIAGQIDRDTLFFRSIEWFAERGIQVHTGVRVTTLDPSGHRFTLDDGTQVEYERLLLATGGRPFVPPVEGSDRVGVFSLRTLDDAEAIKRQSAQVKAAVVIGGGLLGLETARALRTAGPQVTILEFGSHLLPRQLDSEGGKVLQALLEAQGLKVITSARTDVVLGDEGPARGVGLADGRVVEGELVLFSTGIRSNVDLAQECGLELNRATIVDEYLQTSAQDVFASGDTAEFQEMVYGIIPAATDQARVAAANMVSPGSASYSGTIPNTTLKVAGAEVSSYGDATADDESEFQIVRRVDMQAGVYRKFALRDNRIVGAILINDKKRARTVTQLMQRAVDVSAHARQLADDDFDLKAALPA